MVDMGASGTRKSVARAPSPGRRCHRRRRRRAMLELSVSRQRQRAADRSVCGSKQCTRQVKRRLPGQPSDNTLPFRPTSDRRHVRGHFNLAATARAWTPTTWPRPRLLASFDTACWPDTDKRPHPTCCPFSLFSAVCVSAHTMHTPTPSHHNAVRALAPAPVTDTSLMF